MLDHYDPQLMTPILWTLALCKVSEKGKTCFGFIQETIDRNGSNIYRQKLIM